MKREFYKEILVLICFIFILAGCSNNEKSPIIDNETNEYTSTAVIITEDANSSSSVVKQISREDDMSSEALVESTYTAQESNSQKEESGFENLNEKEQYEQIKKAIDNNFEYVIEFSQDNSGNGYVKYDFNSDGKNELLEYSIQTGENKWGCTTVMKCTISIGSFSIVKEYSSDGEINGGLTYLGIVDVNKSDCFVEFYLSDGELYDRVTNTFYRVSEDGIEEVCVIDSQILGYSGEGYIYYWAGCLFNEQPGKDLDLNSVLLFYDINKREYAKSDKVIGRTFSAKGQFFVYKTNDDVECGAPINENEILENKKDRIFKKVNSDEKFSIIEIDDKSAFHNIERDGVNVIYYNDNGIKIRTEDGIEGWIGGFHMVWD